MSAARNTIGIAWTLIVCASFGLPATEPPAAPTPVPVVVGPLPVSAASYPFGAADHTLIPEDLGELGYVEEEYLVGGQPVGIRARFRTGWPPNKSCEMDESASAAASGTHPVTRPFTALRKLTSENQPTASSRPMGRVAT